MKKIIQIQLMIIILLSMYHCQKDSEPDKKTDSIKIGLLASFSGGFVGNDTRRAVQLAISEINSSGGVFEKELELISADTKSDPDASPGAAQELIDAHVVGIIGPQESGTTIAASEVTIKNKIPIISPSATSPEITTLDDNGLVFRTAPSDSFQGKIAARTAILKGFDSAAILYIDNAYGKGLAESFQTEFETKGGTITAVVFYPDMTDAEVEKYQFDADVNEALKSKPTLLYLVSYPVDGAKITIAMRSYITKEHQPQLMGCDGNYGPDFFINADPQIIEGMIGTIPAPASDDSNYKKFVSNYKKSFGYAPELFTETAYDAVYLLAYAMLEADSFDPEKIAEKIQSVSKDGETVGVNNFQHGKSDIASGEDINYEGASGSVDLDDNGDVTSGSYVIWQYQNGKAKTLETIRFP